MTVTLATLLNRVELELALSNDLEVKVMHTATIPIRTDHTWYLTSQQKDDLRRQIANGIL